MQDHLHKAQCLKNLEVLSSIHDNMRALGAQLFKGDRLARLVGKSPPRLRVGKQMVETVTQHDRSYIKDDLTITG